MLPLAAILPIAIICAIIFLLLLGAILCWLRHHRDNRAQLTDNNLSPFSEFSSSTDLPRDERSASQPNDYGRQLPYVHSNSQESLVERPGTTNLKAFSHLLKKWWSGPLFWSGILSNVVSRSKQKRQSIILHRPTHFNSSDAAVESSQMNLPAKSSPSSSCSRGKELDSRVEESALELSPVKTIVKSPWDNDNYKASGNRTELRPASAPLSLAPRGEYCNLTRFTENRSLALNSYPMPVRSSKIANQTAGDMPTQQIPPPPPASCNPRCFYNSSKDDSATGLSSMSLATTDSAILDDGIMRTSSINRDLATSSPYSTVRDGRNQTSSATFNAPLPPPAAFPVLPSSGPRIASLPYGVSRPVRPNVNASGRPQVNPLQLNPVHQVHQRHSMFELSPTADYERQFGVPDVSKGFTVRAQRAASTYSRESSSRALESSTKSAPLFSPKTSDKPFRKGHKRRHSVRLPLMPADILRTTPSSSHIEDANASEEQNVHISSKGKSRAESHNQDSDDVFTSNTRAGKLLPWASCAVEPEGKDPYQRQRAEMSDPTMSSRRNMNTRNHRMSPVRSFKSPSMMTIWEDDGDISESPMRTSMAASRIVSSELEQGNHRSHDNVNSTDGAQLERNDQNMDVPEKPSVRIVQNSDTVASIDKPVGLGLELGESTPGSLYDKDGFLKE